MDAVAPISESEVPATPVGADGLIDRTVNDWYKDAIIYQLHVKAFFDADNNGYGDFRGLMHKLDYVQALDVTVVWLLPFYPSPLRDDGYDIADYRSVNPQYGDIEQFRGFVEEAHRRGIRVVTELVINHTSDQHPWFQAARAAPKGAPERDMYVWSDTDQKYLGTRIIFTDTEKSNWTWDPVAEQFFWHRFFSHQPDLNFDNPKVMEEVLAAMNHWLDMGVDGLRLDAIPYLVERDGTNNENLPETHAVLKQVRAALDEKYPDRMLLAEANQWPEDTRPYFGEGDECHMGFHFPLMPRMYMALAQEDRHPITDIIRQTPEIPDNCQWAIFLRNHDELTLEMVTVEERDYLWQTYASDARARINLGIRRRLAPLMQNDRRKIELMNAFLMSMPGTPVLYYGDEIGMGDNYFLGDRDGVRTPMQWSADRNGGFSRATPQALYLPPVMDPNYGFEAINVEAQENDPSSLLNWTRRIINVRKQHPAFGRGSIEFLYPRNRKIIAYIRKHGDETILVVANLARTAEAAEIDLSAWRDRVPVELTGRTPFPPIGDLPYMLSLAPYGFFWFALAGLEEAPKWYTPRPDPLPDFVTLTTRSGIEGALEGRERDQLETNTLPQFMPLQRWYAGKDEPIRSVRLRPLAILSDDAALAVMTADLPSGPQRYCAPLAIRWGEENLRTGAPKLSYTLAKVRSGARVGALVDGTQDEGLAQLLVQLMQSGGERTFKERRTVFTGSPMLSAIEQLGTPRPIGTEQSNVSIMFGDQLILKIYRRLREGEQPDVEIARHLTAAGSYANTPALFGTIVIESEGSSAVLAAAFAFVPNQGDAWTVVLGALERYLEGAEIAVPGVDPAVPGGGAQNVFPFPLGVGTLAGRRTGELHVALGAPTDDPAFAPEPIVAADLVAWSDAAKAEAEAVLDRLQNALPALADEARPSAEAVLERREELLGRFDAVRAMAPSGLKTRIHGDYHLGQVLVSRGDLVVIDFEGEPSRPLEERRQKSSPLRDAAGMLRSFDYAAAMALARVRATQDVGSEALRAKAMDWRDRTRREFVTSYLSTLGDAAPAGDLTGGLLDLFTLMKAVYEVGYELANRPAWLRIPLAGIVDVLADPRGVAAWMDGPAGTPAAPSERTSND